MSDIYKKIKKQNGEAFAQALRNYHNGLLEIPDIDQIVRHAGRDAAPLLPYLMSLLAANDNTPIVPAPVLDPIALLDQAGYNAFYADTLDAQNSIKKYFKTNELLCTFNDRARYQKYHIIHAVKKDVDTIKRDDFNGKETRQDAYGTSVISIQILKTGDFISIKNRYNHTVPGCDNTFNSNPDNIIQGLSAAIKAQFGVEFSSATENALPDGYVLMDGNIFKYHPDKNNIYYGDQAWATDGTLHSVNRAAGDALFDVFLFDNASKTLSRIDHALNDSFADDFNRCYGGNAGLRVQNGNLMLDNEVLIGTCQSRITTLSLPALTTMGERCLRDASSLTHFSAPALTKMGDTCLYNAYSLTQFSAPQLMTMGNRCIRYAPALAHFSAPVLTTMGYNCLGDTSLTYFSAPALVTMGDDCLRNASSLTYFSAPMLTTMGDDCLNSPLSLTDFSAPALTTMGKMCLHDARALTAFSAPALTTMGNHCLSNIPALTHFSAPALIKIGDHCLKHTPSLTHFSAPALRTMWDGCLYDAPALTHFSAPVLTAIGIGCLAHSTRLTHLSTPLHNKPARAKPRRPAP